MDDIVQFYSARHRWFHKVNGKIFKERDHIRLILKGVPFSVTPGYMHCVNQYIYSFPPQGEQAATKIAETNDCVCEISLL